MLLFPIFQSPQILPNLFGLRLVTLILLLHLDIVRLQPPVLGSYHSGIDIGAPTGATIVAVSSGVVTFTDFSGPNGFTVKVESDSYIFTYSHVSPLFLVSPGDYVSAGSTIATVGPKNVYGVPNNPYKDSNGKPTNGATTGPHLHFSIRKDGKAVNPLNYF